MDFGFSDLDYCFGFSELGLSGFSDTGRLIMYQSTSATKLVLPASANNRKTTLFWDYGFYLGSSRCTRIDCIPGDSFVFQLVIFYKERDYGCISGTGDPGFVFSSSILGPLLDLNSTPTGNRALVNGSG